MKILFLNEYSQPVSGAEYSQKALAQAFGAAEFSPRWPRHNRGQGLTPLWFNNPAYYLYSAWQICRQDFDLLHVHGKYILPGAVMAGWLKRKPVVVTVRDFKFLCPMALCFINQTKCTWKYFLKQEISEYQKRYVAVASWRLMLAKLWQLQLKWWLNRTHKVIAVSPQLASIYRENGINRPVTIYNLPPRRQPLAQGKIILSMGKLSYGKGTDSIVAAAKLLPEYNFIFAGELNASFKPAWSKNCHYLGKVTHDEALSWYQQAGVFIINSRWPEPLSRSGLEALSFGLPIVASNRGGNRELMNNNGALVDPDKPKDLAKAISQVWRRRRKLGQNSQKLLVTRFNRQLILSRHRHLYESLIK